MATTLCVAMASCNKDKDNDESDTPDSGIATAGYVDLGLPSGTKWKADNEANPNDENDFYTYDKALAAFGNQLPTKEQFQELIDNCLWSWNDTKKGMILGTTATPSFCPRQATAIAMAMCNAWVPAVAIGRPCPMILRKLGIYSSLFPQAMRALTTDLVATGFPYALSIIEWLGV